MEISKSPPQVRRGVFWCPEKARMLAVEFTLDGPSLLRKETGILSCSAFDDPSLDPVYRRALWRDWFGERTRRSESWLKRS